MDVNEMKIRTCDSYINYPRMELKPKNRKKKKKTFLVDLFSQKQMHEIVFFSQ